MMMDRAEVLEGLNDATVWISTISGVSLDDPVTEDNAFILKMLEAIGEAMEEVREGMR